MPHSESLRLAVLLKRNELSTQIQAPFDCLPTFLMTVLVIANS